MLCDGERGPPLTTPNAVRDAAARKVGEAIQVRLVPIMVELERTFSEAVDLSVSVTIVVDGSRYLVLASTDNEQLAVDLAPFIQQYAKPAGPPATTH